MLITETLKVKQFSDESEFESTLSFSLEKEDLESWVVVENNSQEISLSLANWIKLVELGNKIISNEKHKKDFIAGAKCQAERMCNHTYILTSEQGHRVIKCQKCDDTQPI